MSSEGHGLTECKMGFGGRRGRSEITVGGVWEIEHCKGNTVGSQAAEVGKPRGKCY